MQLKVFHDIKIKNNKNAFNKIFKKSQVQNDL